MASQLLKELIIYSDQKENYTEEERQIIKAEFKKRLDKKVAELSQLNPDLFS